MIWWIAVLEVVAVLIAYRFGWINGRVALKAEADRALELSRKVLGEKPCPRCHGEGKVTNLDHPDQQRLKWIVRTVNLLRRRIEANGMRYDGTQAPNLQSISDLATVDDAYLEGAEESLRRLEREVAR